MRPMKKGSACHRISEKLRTEDLFLTRTRTVEEVRRALGERDGWYAHGTIRIALQRLAQDGRLVSSLQWRKGRLVWVWTRPAADNARAEVAAATS